MHIVVTSGYFDPIHVGHLEYLRRAKELGMYHICIINNDVQAKLKKEHSFMPAEDRARIVRALRCVDDVVVSIDEDESVKETLKSIRRQYVHDTIIFAKGGDRVVANTPEVSLCHELGIYIMEGLGEKIRASSDFIRKANEEA